MAVGVLHAQRWSLQWSDEFNSPAGTLPSSANWTYDTGNSGFGNPEAEYYCAPTSTTAPCRPDQPNAFQDGKGHLVLRAVRDGEGRWTSARLKSQGLRQFKYGRIEARMRLPVGPGFWPAFWMLGSDIGTVPWPGCGEQDIVEWVQKYGPAASSSTTHGPGYSGDHGITAQSAFPNGGRVDDADFHVYGVIWKPNSLQYYRDDPAHVFLTTTPATLPPGSAWVFDKPFFLLLNFAIGTGGFPGTTNATTPSDASVLVDYVRVYTDVESKAP
jgi:beta-glucanase (GH16 family)